MIITLLLTFGFIAFPFVFRILRQNIAFIFFITLSIIYVLLEYNLIYNNLYNVNIPKKSEFLYSFNPLIFLTTFKIIDFFFLKYKNRHIYFTPRFSSSFSNEEAEKAEFIDLIFQILITFSPFITIILSGRDKL